MTSVTINVNRILTSKFNIKKNVFNRSLTRKMSNCIFCKIIAGNAPGDILYQDDEIIVFKDIKPASKFHFLAIPKQHIDNVNRLTKDDIQLVNKFITCGKQVLNDKGGNTSDIMLGFHLPPFNTVSHLHLHIISPASTMSMLHRVMFKPHTLWFSSVDQILERLQRSNKL